ncbi:MAG TPA: MFS transporter [Gemmatimonadaceae bacterium]|nr:MFS transporter [Gemmatimonadaceae bacterium]
MNETASDAPRSRYAALAASAFAFVVVMGIVNLFADITYEGGGSINGPFMGSLGAGAAAISIVAGLGEFLGYSLRAVSGWAADRTGKYWALTFVGYGINLFAVPAMAFAGNWEIAGVLILTERIGRAIRKPTVGAMLSYSTGALGRGWVYGLNSALDETGATIGPIILAIALSRGLGYRHGYALLFISAACAIAALVVARVIFPVPSRLETDSDRRAAPAGFTPSFWLFMLAAGCFGAGLMSFEFISFHLASRHVVSLGWIPLFLAISTGVGVFVNLALGKLYDRAGLRVVLVAVFVSSLFSPLVFLGGFGAALVGLVLWGVGYATQDTLLKAVLAGMLPEGKRNLAFGLFYTGYGVGWLIGSVVTGLLYRSSIPAVIVFAMAVQLVSIPIFIQADKRRRLPDTA